MVRLYFVNEPVRIIVLGMPDGIVVRCYRVVVESRENDWEPWERIDQSNLFEKFSWAEAEMQLLQELYKTNPVSGNETLDKYASLMYDGMR